MIQGQNLNYTNRQEYTDSYNILPMTTSFPPVFLCQKKTSLWQNWCPPTRIGIYQHSLSRGNLMLPTHEILWYVLKLNPGKKFGEEVT
jgi:hypothetical protein